jgi:hypothetical protein
MRSSSHAFKNLTHGNHTPKMDIFVLVNDKYVYFNISSLHKKLIPRLNTKYQHEVMKRKI